MKCQFVDMYGKLLKGIPAFALRDIYMELTGDTSTARTSDEGEVDKRL